MGIEVLIGILQIKLPNSYGYCIVITNIYHISYFNYVIKCFRSPFFTASLGALSMSFGLFMSPFIIGICKRKSTRLTAVIGGLVLSLGCLFSSFANQFHQLYFSHAVMTGKKLLSRTACCAFALFTRG